MSDSASSPVLPFAQGGYVSHAVNRDLSAHALHATTTGGQISDNLCQMIFRHGFIDSCDATGVNCSNKHIAPP